MTIEYQVYAFDCSILLLKVLKNVCVCRTLSVTSIRSIFAMSGEMNKNEQRSLWECVAPKPTQNNFGATHSQRDLCSFLFISPLIAKIERI